MKHIQLQEVKKKKASVNTPSDGRVRFFLVLQLRTVLSLLDLSILGKQ